MKEINPDLENYIRREYGNDEFSKKLTIKEILQRKIRELDKETAKYYKEPTYRYKKLVEDAQCPKNS